VLDLDIIFDPDAVQQAAAAARRPPPPLTAASKESPQANETVILGPDDLPTDWRHAYEERAGIMEYEANMTRARAEAEALADTIRTMRREADMEQAAKKPQNPLTSMAGLANNK
jgi:hypothetical protein